MPYHNFLGHTTIVNFVLKTAASFSYVFTSVFVSPVSLIRCQDLVPSGLH